MNKTRHHLSMLLGLNPAERHPATTTRARFTATAVAAFATAVQVIVWLMLAIFGAHLDGPWWLWTPASAVLIDAGLLLLDQVRRHWSTAANRTGTVRGSL
ncbi:hypothetical protein [Actinocatenispora thailandica]|nr:hypothetical protein [Actinocatenispora thailandica]